MVDERMKLAAITQWVQDMRGVIAMVWPSVFLSIMFTQ